MPSTYTKRMEQMHALVRGEMTPESLASALNVESNRLAAYPRFVRNHVFDMLEKHFGCLHDLLGDRVWKELCQTYFTQVPCQDYDLNLAAEHFPEFILQDEIEQKHGLSVFHAELCQLEWEEYVVFKTKVHWPDKKCATPVLHPAVSIFEFTHTAGSFLLAWRQGQAGQKDAQSMMAAPKSERVMVLQHPRTCMSRTYVANAELLLAFKVVHDGLTLAQMCDASRLSEKEMLQVLFAAQDKGLIVLPRDWGVA